MFVNRENPRVLTSFFFSQVLDLIRVGRAGAQRVGVCGLAFKGMVGTVNWQTIVFALARSKFAWKIPDESTEIDTRTEHTQQLLNSHLLILESRSVCIITYVRANERKS